MQQTFDFAVVGANDLASGEDLAAPDLAASSGDLASVHDLAVAHDLAGSVPDLSAAPDLSAVPDLASAAPDLASTDLAGVDQASVAIKHVFIILMENANWSSWKGSSSAMYLNTTLLPIASHAEMYFNPAGIHPSLPNYLWLEAGDSLGVTADGAPSSYHQSTTSHLVTQLENAGHTWKSYVEGIDGKSCPLTDSGEYVTRHVPALYFDDVTNTNSTTSARCIAHVRPYSELAGDLSNNTLADYNFITPNLCDDAHGSDPLAGDFTCVAVITDLIKTGDTWLSNAVPAIIHSAAFGNDSVLFVAWDEGDLSSSDGPIGFIAVGAKVKGGGYASNVKYDHSSTLRSIEEIFGLPYLRAAGNATTNDLSDLFTQFP
jgi:hypothetical protein